MLFFKAVVCFHLQVVLVHLTAVEEGGEATYSYPCDLQTLIIFVHAWMLLAPKGRCKPPADLGQFVFLTDEHDSGASSCKGLPLFPLFSPSKVIIMVFYPKVV